MKYCGNIGFSRTVETAPGVWTPTVTLKRYYGEVQRAARKTQAGQGVNDSLRMNQVLSIVADPFANENLFAIAFAEFMGVRWKVTDVEVQYPRLLLTLGGRYHDESKT